MFGIESLDVMIGIITVYLIFALACTAIVEVLTSLSNVRSKNLEVALREFLHGNLANGTEFIDAFFAHPLIQTLSVGVDGRPSYITPEIVGQVVADLIKTSNGATTLQQAASNLPGTIFDNRIKGIITLFQSEAGENIAAFRHQIAHHYDAAMDRASGWYKRKTQAITFAVATVLVLAANVDTLSLANSLSSNPEARARMVELAQRQVDAAARPDTPAANTNEQNTADPVKNTAEKAEQAAENLARANADLTSAGIQLGWKEAPKCAGEYLGKLFGLLISILAISLGAPFWFDMLSRVMQVRAAGASPRDKNKPK